MPELKSLEVPKKPESTNDAPCEVEREKYGYGTTISLDDETVIDRFDDIMKSKADEQVKVIARGFIKKVSSEDIAGGKKRRSVEIQITDMSIAKDSDKELADGFDTATA